LRSSRETVSEYLSNWVFDNEISMKDKESILNRVSFYKDLFKAASKADFVIEAVVERLDIKRKVFREVDEVCPEDAIIATNSSSIRVSKIENTTMHPERVLNMHFYSFPWKRRILELMRGNFTTDEVFQGAIDFGKSINLIPLRVLKESTGFIFNRVWRAIKKECLQVVDEGVASFEDVDRAWMSLYKTKFGPFALMDRVGLDVVRDIELVYFEESSDPRDKPPKILLDKIKNGELGVKTGKGFYNYPNPSFEEVGWLDKN
jgi:3-hydroxybutyryl-CoA dehydrogenase